MCSLPEAPLYLLRGSSRYSVSLAKQQQIFVFLLPDNKRCFWSCINWQVKLPLYILSDSSTWLWFAWQAGADLVSCESFVVQQQIFVYLIPGGSRYLGVSCQSAVHTALVDWLVGSSGCVYHLPGSSRYLISFTKQQQLFVYLSPNIWICFCISCQTAVHKYIRVHNG